MTFILSLFDIVVTLLLESWRMCIGIGVWFESQLIWGMSLDNTGG